MFDAAMRGELGSLAQQIAKYQMKRRIEKEMDKFKAMDGKFKKNQTEKKQDDENVNKSFCISNFLIINKFYKIHIYYIINIIFLIISYKII